MLTTEINGNNVIYGTLEECVAELFNRIDFRMSSFPDFDFATYVNDDITQKDMDDATDVCDLGESWYGCKDLGNKFFDSDTISVMFGHYGGGGIRALELYDDECMEPFIQTLIDSAYGDLGRDSYTIFEFIRR